MTTEIKPPPGLEICATREEAFNPRWKSVLDHRLYMDSYGGVYFARWLGPGDQWLRVANPQWREPTREDLAAMHTAAWATYSSSSAESMRGVLRVAQERGLCGPQLAEKDAEIARLTADRDAGFRKYVELEGVLELLSKENEHLHARIRELSQEHVQRARGEETKRYAPLGDQPFAAVAAHANESPANTWNHATLDEAAANLLAREVYVRVATVETTRKVVTADGESVKP